MLESILMKCVQETSRSCLKIRVNYMLTASLVCDGLNTILNMFIIRSLMIKTKQNAFGPSYNCIKALINWLINR